MKKFFALLLTICMLGSCVAFAEAPAEEDPQSAIAEMIDQLWYGALTQVADGYNNTVDTVDSTIALVSDMLNDWFTQADSRYTESRSALADAVAQVIVSVSELAGQAQTIINDDQLNARAAEIQANIDELTAQSEQLTAEAVSAIGTRLAENKDDVVNSTSNVITNVLNAINDLLFVITGSSDTEAQSRMGEVSNSSAELISTIIDKVLEALDVNVPEAQPAQ